MALPSQEFTTSLTLPLPPRAQAEAAEAAKPAAITGISTNPLFSYQPNPLDRRWPLEVSCLLQAR